MKFPDCEMIGIDHGDEFPWHRIKPYETVYMVDFSLPKEDMKRLNDSCHLVWIDHHITAMKTINSTKISGIRDNEFAACHLVWEFCYPNKPMPKAVKLLGDYDIWKHDDHDCLPFQMGMRLNRWCPEYDINEWKKLFNNRNFLFPYYKKFLKQGKTVLQYQNNLNKSFMKYAFDVEFEGYNCIAVNCNYGNSKTFDSVPFVDENYDIKIMFNYDGLKWKYSLYSCKESNVNVGKIAQIYGGGGHKNAAGFIINKKLF